MSFRNVADQIVERGQENRSQGEVTDEHGGQDIGEAAERRPRSSV